MTVGRSWRTYAKHELMNSVVGQEVGVINQRTFKMDQVDRLVWFDLTAGDAAPVDDTEWRRCCSPGILAYHATNSRKPVVIRLYEIQPATFDRLLKHLEEYLPDLGYVRDGESCWRHGDTVEIRAVNASGRAASVDLIGKRDAVLVFNDPNAITEWAMRDTFAQEIVDQQAWCFRSLSTMGCNTAGIKRLELRERLDWFDLIDTQESVLPHYRDLLLAAIEKDEAQWAYLLSTSVKEKWRGQAENEVKAAFRTALKRMPKESRGRTAGTAWYRQSPSEFEETKLQLFLTKAEREALRGRERQWLAAGKEERLLLLGETKPSGRGDGLTLFSLGELGETA